MLVGEGPAGWAAGVDVSDGVGGAGVLDRTGVLEIGGRVVDDADVLGAADVELGALLDDRDADVERAWEDDGAGRDELLLLADFEGAFFDDEAFDVAATLGVVLPGEFDGEPDKNRAIAPRVNNTTTRSPPITHGHGLRRRSGSASSGGSS